MEKQLIGFDDFKKLDIRIAKVLSVENHPNADKLYILKVDIGPAASPAVETPVAGAPEQKADQTGSAGREIRQCVAGLRPFISPERLLNRHVAMVVNLQPAMLRGMESTAMLLAASDETPAGREVVLLLPEKELPPGSKVS
jgi:methionyl-tRNA synthetase